VDLLVTGQVFKEWCQNVCYIKGNIVPVHTTKACEGSGGVAPHILNLSIVWSSHALTALHRGNSP
jgi:hypothetical protein